MVKSSPAAPLPGVAPGLYYVVLRANILATLPERTFSNNLSASLTQTSADAPALLLGTPASGTLKEGQAAYYKVDVPAGQTLQVALNSEDGSASNELYVSRGTMPTRSRYDFRYHQPFVANQQITIPTMQAGAYYILAYADSLPNGREGWRRDYVHRHQKHPTRAALRRRRQCSRGQQPV